MSNKFWFGGTGTWDSTTVTHWGTTSGGPTTTTPPGSGDIAIFDGNSGGGTVTVDATISGATIQGLTTSAFTGTLDFSVNNPSLTITTLWTDAATSAHTINMGSGTWTFSGLTSTLINITAGANLTLTATASTIVFAPSASATNFRTLATGNHHFGTFTVNGTNQNGIPVSTTGNSTIDTLNITNGGAITFTAGTATTITNALTLNGTSSAPIALIGGGGSAPSLLATGGVTSLTWAYISHMIITGISGGAVNATNSFDGSGNNLGGGTISPPSGGGGGGGHIIGG